jgi:hypothetical protein
MFYVSGCPFCEGAVGFRRCSDGKTLVLVCDERDAVWLRPDDINAKNAIFLKSPDFFIESLGCSIAKKYGARWATLEEIKAVGWEPFVAGECGALGD